jgi:voltage-gated potassium channel
MTQIPPGLPGSRHERWRIGLGALLRVSITIVVLFGAYYLIPTKADDAESDLPWLILELVVFGVVAGTQVPAILKAKYPILRAIQALAITIPLFLLIFSRIYLSNSLDDPQAFTQVLDKTNALYFTVTVFATVGFGDIVATTGGMKILVTVQMLLNLTVLGAVIRLITSAAQRGVARKEHKGPGPAEAEDGPG